MRNNFYTVSLTVILAILMSGCSFKDKVADEINKQFPPVSIDQVRSESINNNTDSLRKLNSIDLRLRISEEGVTELLHQNEKLELQGITNISVILEKQIPTLTIQFLKQFTLDDQNVKVDIEGQISGHLGISVEVSGDKSKTEGKLTFQPVLDSLAISSAKVNGKYDIQQIVNSITSLLNTYRNNVSGELQRSIDPMLFPISFSESFNPNDATVSGDSVVNVIGKIVKMDAQIEGFALLIDQGRIDILVDLDGSGDIYLPTTTAKNSDFDEYRKIYLETSASLPSPESEGKLEMSINKTYLSRKLNQAINSADLVVIGNYQPKGSHPFFEKVGLPSEDSIDCTPTRECSNNHIDCTPTRDCTATKDCGGYEWYQAPDKARCELEKSAAKLDCERIKSTEKGKCEAKKSGWKLDCERIKSQDKLTCEAEKEIVKRINRTGNFANVKGSVAIDAQAKVAVKEFHASGESIKSTIELEAEARIDTQIHFTPLDIVGHLACQAPWRDRFRTTASVAKQSLVVSVKYSTMIEGDDVFVVAKVAPFSISATTTPSPKSLILNSQEFTIHCLPLAGLLRAVDIVLPDVIPDEANGKLLFEQAETTIKQKVDPIVVKLGDSEITAKIVNGRRNISAIVK